MQRNNNSGMRGEIRAFFCCNSKFAKLYDNFIDFFNEICIICGLSATKRETKNNIRPFSPLIERVKS